MYWGKLHFLTSTELNDTQRLLKGKIGKAIPLQTWTDPYGSRRMRFPELLQNRHTKVVKFSALRPGRHYPPPSPHKRSLLIISLPGCVDSRAPMPPEELSQYRIPKSPWGIEPATFRLTHNKCRSMYRFITHFVYCC